MRVEDSEVGKGTTLQDGDDAVVAVVGDSDGVSPSTCMASTSSRSALIVEAISVVFVVVDADAVARESLHVGRARRSGVG